MNMKVHQPDDPNEDVHLQTLYDNLTDRLWNCDNEKWGGCWSVHHLTLSNTPWMYRGEGNANLVISLPREKLILRLQKLEYEMRITNCLIEERENKLLRDIQFHRTVMTSFLGTSLFQPPLLAKISEKEISQVDQKLFSSRPSFRLTKGIRCGLVTVHPDYTHLPPIHQSYSSNFYDESVLLPGSSATYCIEIKPKQGWIPFVDRKHPKCTFCMNQYLKIMKERVSEISQYCPLDLFSGNVMRMKRAIKNLLKTPQNNLKIFKNGDLVFSEDCNKNFIDVLKDIFMIENIDQVNTERLIDRWCSLVVSCLRKQLSNVPTVKNNTDFCSDMVSSLQINNSSLHSSIHGHIKPCDWSSQPLPKNCILERILKLQQLQNSNFASVCALYRERCSTENDYSYMNSLLSNNGNIDIIQRYLLATTAKDCSIFLALQAAIKVDLPSKIYYIKDCEGLDYRLNIGISDIDPKPLSCIAKHMKRDKEVLDAVLQFINRTTPA